MADQNQSNPTSKPSGKPDGKPQKIAAPKGTRDLYPEDVLRQRYITNAWRDVSIRHGFEEIAGPTFEQAQLYAVKSGDGILSELFQAFSGKSPDEVQQVQETGQAPYALRPEFTPTLARMYAAHAKQLPKPCKWFTAGPYFRAERPQRGRLREFLQWNCDVIGNEATPISRGESDVEVIAVLVEAMDSVGLARDMQTGYSVRLNHRKQMASILQKFGVGASELPKALSVLDGFSKMRAEEFVKSLVDLGVSSTHADSLQELLAANDPSDLQALQRPGWTRFRSYFERLGGVDIDTGNSETEQELTTLLQGVDAACGDEVATFDLSVVRGLAYYTGTVFEVIAEGERAIAGGGRYDNLIELFGGPPTPACGFGMGDVVLGILLDEKGLIPEGKELMDAVSQPGASVRPEAFVINGGNADDAGELDACCRRLVADLRRGIESKAYADRGDEAKPWHADRHDPASQGVRPLHARQSYKSTRNLKKLLSDAEKQFARYAVVVHEPEKVELRDLDTRADLTPVDVPGLPSDHATFSVDPQSPVYAGRAIAALLR